MNAPFRLKPIETAKTNLVDAEAAAKELASQLLHPDLGFVLFFCSAEYQLDALAKAMSKAFPTVEIAGCTTAGELTSTGYERGSISAIGFDRHYFAIEVGLVAELDRFGLQQAQTLVDKLFHQGRNKQVAPSKGHTFAMTLLDGLSSQEEMVLVALDSALGNIPHFGGSAGDDIQLANTHIFYNGKFHNEAAVLILINTPLDFEVFTTHHMRSLEQKLVVTKANPSTRTVLEFNAAPAAIEYAALVGIAPEDLNPKVFALHPLAVRIGNEYYVRSIQRVNADLSLTFYCAVGNGIVLTAMEPQPILPDLEKRFAEIESRIGTPLITLGCDCFLRRLETAHLGTLKEASEFFIKHRVVGFNTYGEHFDGVHINQTFTGVVIGGMR